MQAEVVAAKPPTTKQRKAASRRQLKHASLLTQLAWWSSRTPADGIPHSACRAECRRIQKAIGRLVSLTPSVTWAEDAARLPPERGGQFPPADENGVPLMVRAKGERAFYPRSYIVTSGHSYEVFLEAIHTGTSRKLEDGEQVSRHRALYMGGRIAIGEMVDVDRRRLHDAEAAHDPEHGRMITNVL